MQRGTRIGIVAVGALIAALVVGLAAGRNDQVEAQRVGITIPDVAREFLSQAELVESVCVTTRWRALELFAVIDALTETQPAAQAALVAAEIDYTLPDPEAYRTQAQATMDAICSAPTVDQAVAGVDALFAINVDMEARYGALSEALGGEIKARVDVIEQNIRPQLDAWAAEQRAEIEAELQPEGQAIADQYLAQEQASAQAQIEALAKSLAASGAGEAEITAAINQEIAALQASANAAITARVQEALADRIAEAEARIRAEAEIMAEQLAGRDAAALRALQPPFDAMLARVNAAVAAARTADSPEKRAAVETRVRLAMKAVDGRLALARPLVEAARAELAARAAASAAFPDADEILAAMTERRDRLETDFRAAAEAGDETAFAAASTAFGAYWEQMAADVNGATGVWTASRVCEQALPAVTSAIPEAEDALEQIQGASAGFVGSGEDGQALREALSNADSRLVDYINSLRGVSTACAGAADGEARALISMLDALRVEQVEVRLAVESASEIARAIGEGN